MATSVVGQTMELREEPRQFVESSLSYGYPTKPMAFASDDDEPPAYMNDLPHRGHDYPSRTRTRDGNWRNSPAIPSVYSPQSPQSVRGRDFDIQTVELPLRPNRRDDQEFARGPSTASQVFLPISTPNRPRRKSSGGNSSKNWFRNIRSPIGKRLVCLLVLLVC